MTDPRIPAYLGRVLAPTGTPTGTCFQASPGILVTAWHVLDDLGSGNPGATVTIDALNGALAPTTAEVARIDPLHDLTVLTTPTPLPTSVQGFFATDWVKPTTEVLITGVSKVDDQDHDYHYLDATGKWEGGTTRDRQIPLGRLSSSSVMPGMSGAPVRRLPDDLIVGLVSARYNTADGWLEHSVWVARTEDIQVLLAGLAPLALDGPPPLSGAVDLVLTVSDSTVTLTGPNIVESAPHAGVRPGLAAAINDARRERARVAVTSRQAAPTTQDSTPGSVSLRRAGDLLAESFLPDPISTALAKVLRQAEKQHAPVRIGIDAPHLSSLPWEAMPEPATFRPLALHPLITAYRKVPAPPVRAIPGPLRIVVAIAAPLRGGGPMLDYERELRNVLSAVRAARQGDADVRVVPFATTTAIRAALDESPAHVLHLSCHGGPGTLELEDDHGTARMVTAKQLVEEAIPPGQMPPVFSMSACYTDTPAAEGAPSFASELIDRGASVVVGTETSVTDWYATSVFARIYQELAQSAEPDIVSAVADARRLVQRHLSTSDHPRDTLLANLDEWSVVTVLAGTGSTRVFDPTVKAPLPEHRHSSIAGLLSRDTGEFVGRRREQRELPMLLASSKVSGIVLHGIGGVGKTTLASELIRRVNPPVLAVLNGELSVDAILSKVASTLRRHLEEGPLMRAVQFANRVDEPWQDRFDSLRDHILDRVHLLLVLDNFEDNLTDDRQLRDGGLAALLTRWSTDPGASRLLITSRYQFTLPDQSETHLQFHQIGPLSMAETFKLIWALPALDRLEDAELERVWRLVGGHPRSLEYLDALLNHGNARYHDVTARITKAAQSLPEAQRALTAPTLDAALAQTLTLIADDVLLDELLTRLADIPGAQDLLFGASVYREPVDTNAVLFHIGETDEDAAYVPDRMAAMQHISTVLADHGITLDDNLRLDDLSPETVKQILPALAELTAPPRPPRSTSLDLSWLLHGVAATTLLTFDPGADLVFVHRWTASELERRMSDQGKGDQLRQAHRRAAEFWRWLLEARPSNWDAALRYTLEARHHLFAAGDLEEAGEVSEWACSRLQVIGAWDQEATLIHDTISRLSPESPRRAAWFHQLGNLAYLRGDYVEAELLYRKTLTMNEELGDRAGIAPTYHQLGLLAYSRGDYVEAERWFQQALIIDEELDDQLGIAREYHQLGLLAMDRGDYSEVERRCREAILLNERLDNQSDLATNYILFGKLAQGRGDYAGAELHYRQALTISERLGDRFCTARCYRHLGDLAFLRDDCTGAEHFYQQSLTIREGLDTPSDVAGTIGQLGMLAHHQGDYIEAERRYRQALAIYGELGIRAGMAIGYHQFGMLEQDRDNLREAATWYIRALILKVELQVPLVDNVRAVADLRRRLGAESFAEIVTTVVDDDNAVTGVMQLIDECGSTLSGEESSPGGEGER
jgi:tetratricopeptide (TPR) repeat protein